MLDETIVVEKKESTTFAPLPNDMYQVELLDITSKEHETFDSKKARANDASLTPIMETVFDFQFTVLETTEVDGKSIRGRNIFENFVPSYLYIGKNGKNTLYQIVEALQGQTISPEQEAMGITGKELNMLIGKQCRVITVQKTKGDKTYMNIDNYLTIKAPLTPLTEEEKKEAFIKPKVEEEAQGEG